MTNPLLEDLQESGTIETVSIALPTSGRFYDDGVIDEDASVEDLEIKSIGIMAELSTRDPFLLASGKGMELLIPQICPAINAPEKLAEIDIEAILIASRIATHGNHMILEHKCTNPVQAVDNVEEPCGEENKIDVNLYDIIMRYGPLEFNDSFVVDLPEYNQRVFLKPIEYGHALAILRDALINTKDDMVFNNTQVSDILNDVDKMDAYSEHVMKKAITTMEGIIHSIFYVESKTNGQVHDHEAIKEWLLAISKDNVKKILKKAAELNGELHGNNIVKYQCAKCSAENTTTIELDIQRLFFFTPQNSDPQKKPIPILKEKRKRKTTQ